MRLTLFLALFLMLSAPLRADVDQDAEALLGALERQGGAAEPASAQWRLVELSTPIGTRFNAYVAGPADADRAIVLLHDRWGLDETMRSRVEAFARRGYRALAVDLFDDRHPDSPAMAEEIMAATDPAAARVDMLAAIDHLRAPGRKVALMGWGFGGRLAYEGALAASDRLAAVVVWYAPLYRDAAQTRAVTVPLMGVFASADERISEEEVARYEAMTRKSRNIFRAYTYEAGYGFAHPGYGTYDAGALAEAWEDVDRFLAAHAED